MTDEELGWVAGFLEGEGSVSVSWTGPKRANKQIAWQCSQVQREPLERLQRYTGVGKISGPYDYQRGNRQPFSIWRLARSADFDHLVCSVFHLLSPRRKAQILNAYELPCA